MVIGEYYLNNVCEKGTWYQLVSADSGEPTSDVIIVFSFFFIRFMILQMMKSGEPLPQTE